MIMRPRCSLGHAGSDHWPLVLTDPGLKILDGNRYPRRGRVRVGNDVQPERIIGAVVQVEPQVIEARDPMEQAGQVLEQRGQLPVGADCFSNLQKCPVLLGGGMCLSFLCRFMHFKILRGITHAVFRSRLARYTYMIPRRTSVRTFSWL